MLRKSARISGRVVVSAVISWTLIPIAVADAPAPSANPPSAAESAEAKFKRLHTVPEDGIGDDHWLSGATNFVRMILAQRPNEDLVICIAGCVPKQDRVVYAQPAEPTSRKPLGVVSDAAPVATPATEAETPAQAATAPADQSKPAVAADGDAKKLEFVPSMAKPETAGAASEGSTESAPETVEAPSNDAVEPEATETPDTKDLR